MGLRIVDEIRKSIEKGIKDARNFGVSVPFYAEGNANASLKIVSQSTAKEEAK